MSATPCSVSGKIAVSTAAEHLGENRFVGTRTTILVSGSPSFYLEIPSAEHEWPVAIRSNCRTLLQVHLQSPEFPSSLPTAVTVQVHDSARIALAVVPSPSVGHGRHAPMSNTALIRPGPSAVNVTETIGPHKNTIFTK